MHCIISNPVLVHELQPNIPFLDVESLSCIMQEMYVKKIIAMSMNNAAFHILDPLLIQVSTILYVHHNYIDFFLIG